MIKKVILGLFTAATVANTCFASNYIGDVIELSTVKEATLSSDEQATVFIKDSNIYRCNTRDGKIMQIDVNRLDENINGVVVGGDSAQVPNDAKLVSNTSWNGMNYISYKLKDGTIMRLNSLNGTVKSISLIANNI